MIDNQTFEGLTFPVARVRYAGPTDTRGSRFVASIRRDRERTYRATRPYHSEEPEGARQAIHAATLCFAKALADNDPGAKVKDYVAIPGDLSTDEYAFTFVPRYFFDGKDA